VLDLEPRGRGRERPTGPVVDRYPVQVEEGEMGAWPDDAGGSIGAIARMAEALRHRTGGHRASLDREDGAGGKNG
jgi:hypothetical protein